MMSGPFPISVVRHFSANGGLELMSAICSADDELESISSVGSDVGGQDDEQKMDPLAEYMYNDLHNDDGFHRSAAFNYF